MYLYVFMYSYREHFTGFFFQLTQTIYAFYFYFFNPHSRICFIDFRERERRRVRVMSERKRRNIDASCRHRHPDQVLNPQSRYVPWLGIEPTTLRFTGQCTNQLSYTGQGRKNFICHTFCFTHPSHLRHLLCFSPNSEQYDQWPTSRSTHTGESQQTRRPKSLKITWM